MVSEGRPRICREDVGRSICPGGKTETAFATQGNTAGAVALMFTLVDCFAREPVTLALSTGYGRCPERGVEGLRLVAGFANDWVKRDESRIAGLEVVQGRKGKVIANNVRQDQVQVTEKGGIGVLVREDAVGCYAIPVDKVVHFSGCSCAKVVRETERREINPSSAPLSVRTSVWRRRYLLLQDDNGQDKGVRRRGRLVCSITNNRSLRLRQFLRL